MLAIVAGCGLTPASAEKLREFLNGVFTAKHGASYKMKFLNFNTSQLMQGIDILFSLGDILKWDAFYFIGDIDAATFQGIESRVGELSKEMAEKVKYLGDNEVVPNKLHSSIYVPEEFISLGSEPEPPHCSPPGYSRKRPADFELPSGETKKQKLEETVTPEVVKAVDDFMAEMNEGQLQEKSNADKARSPPIDTVEATGPKTVWDHVKDHRSSSKTKELLPSNDSPPEFIPIKNSHLHANPMQKRTKVTEHNQIHSCLVKSIVVKVNGNPLTIDLRWILDVYIHGMWMKPSRNFVKSIDNVLYLPYGAVLVDKPPMTNINYEHLVDVMMYYEPTFKYDKYRKELWVMTQ